MSVAAEAQPVDGDGVGAGGGGVAGPAHGHDHQRRVMNRPDTGGVMDVMECSSKPIFH